MHGLLKHYFEDGAKAFSTIPSTQGSLNASGYGYVPGPVVNVLPVLSHLILIIPSNLDITAFSKFKLGQLSAFSNVTLFLCNGAIIEIPGLSDSKTYALSHCVRCL